MAEQRFFEGIYVDSTNKLLPAAIDSEKSDDFLKKYHDLILNDFANKSNMRVVFAKNIFTLVCIYLVVVGLFLWQSGMTFKDFKLSDKVLITLLTTTSANIISLFVFVVKYLFPEDKK